MLLLYQFPIIEQLGYFQFFTLITGIAINIFVHLDFYILRSTYLGSHKLNHYVSIFLSYVFPNSYPRLY